MGRRKPAVEGIAPEAKAKEKKYVSQTDIPRHSLVEALRIPGVLVERFGLQPTRPLAVAGELGLQPTASGFRTLTGAAVAYGLTEGGALASEIALTPLSRRILVPTEEGGDLRAKRQAIMQPRVAREFLIRYEGKPLPNDVIARNVLAELGVPRDATGRCLTLILDNAKEVGALRSIKGSTYVDLGEGVPAPKPHAAPEQAIQSAIEPALRARRRQGAETSSTPAPSAEPQVASSVARVPSPAPGQEGGPLRRDLSVDAYQLEARLGAGFSAEVWSAVVRRIPEGVEVSVGQEVAIKFYHPHALALPDQVLRVEREFRIAQSIRHPNLIRIYEFLLSSSRPHHNFLVMALARGRSLKAVIPPLGLSSQKALQIGRQVLLAIGELHEMGALHRDVKPGNIAVADETGGLHATLLDLGIINVMHERGVTAASHFVGSKHWAPYEQLVGDDIDRRTDLYSVGAVIYNMLTGEEPYRDKGTEAAVAVEMVRRPLRLPDNISIPEEVRKLINACLSTNAAERPDTAKQCLDVLERIL